MSITLKKKNFAKSTLASGISDVAVSLTADTGDGGKFPSSGKFRAVLWGTSYINPSDDPNVEIVEAELDAGDTFDITRAKEGTSAQAWSASDNVAHVLTAETIDEIENEIAAGPADGSITQAKLADYAAGDLIVASSDGEISTTSAEYEKRKETVLARTGTLRIAFDLRANTGSNTGYAQICRNGSPVGTERTTSEISFQPFSEDIAGWNPNDLCQLYMKVEGGNAAFTRNFRIKSTFYTIEKVIT